LCFIDFGVACGVDCVEQFVEFEVVMRFEVFGCEVAWRVYLVEYYVVVFIIGGDVGFDYVVDVA